MKLRAPAIINGGVTTPMLSMEDGVLFNGTLEMEEATSTSQRDTTHLHAVTTSNEPAIRRVST
jgi:cytoskeletal protein CcmA (bactofilin family)